MVGILLQLVVEFRALPGLYTVFYMTGNFVDDYLIEIDCLPHRIENNHSAPVFVTVHFVLS